MGVKAPLEMKPTGVAGEAVSDEGEDLCPDSWEMADLEESMKRLMPVAAPREEDKSFDCGGNAAASSSSFSSNDEDAWSSQVDEFLREALQNPQDRLTILRLEQEVEKFVKNPRQQQYEFPPMASSYMRLAVHRVAQHYFLLTSVMDSSCAEACRIIVRKSGENKLPSIRLADVPVSWEGGSSSSTKFVIKQRPQGFLSSGDGMGSSSGSGNNSSKTVEERNEEYNRARARIFEMEQRGGGAPGGGYEDHHHHHLLEVERPESRKSSRPPEVQDQLRRSIKVEKDQGKSRQKVAIFRDREKDRKDPDYDRNYDRYSQRFDPGFGLNQPAFGGMQARYTPALNYNTEFPQLGCPPRPSAQPGQGWFPGGQPQEMLRPSFNHPRGAAPPPPNMATYQYPYPRPSMGSYTYSPQLSQTEASSAQARRQ